MAREDKPWFIVNDYYRKLYQESEDTDVHRYLSEKFRQIELLYYSIQQRESTLKRCAEAILSHQEEYFRIGNAGLSPLSMKQIASELNIHISTVSRALKNKYLQSVQGTVPLAKQGYASGTMKKISLVHIHNCYAAAKKDLTHSQNRQPEK